MSINLVTVFFLVPFPVPSDIIHSLRSYTLRLNFDTAISFLSEWGNERDENCREKWGAFVCGSITAAGRMSGFTP
jgi:hypothetical protein